MRVEVWYRDEIGDGRAARLQSSLHSAGGAGIGAVHVRDVYIVVGVPELTSQQLMELVCDRVAQAAELIPATGPAATGPATTGPAATGPAATGPAATGPAATGPAATGPAATGPAATGPAATGPAATGPAATGPAATGPAATGPAAAPAAAVPPTWDLLLEVAARPGVTDPVATTLRNALAATLGLEVPASALVQTARQYRFRGAAGGPVDRATLGALFNPLIHTSVVLDAREWLAGERPAHQYPAVGDAAVQAQVAAADTQRFAVAGMSDEQLIALSAERLLALTLPELSAVRAYYQSPAVRAGRYAAGLGDEVTDVELEMIAQTWSEHCKHKIFNATIEYREADRVETIHSLFDSYIRATTRAVDPGDGFLRSVFHDNSGVIEFDDETLLCFKAETHNSPSALDPYGGAITGIVGVNRDIIGTGRGARPLFNTNVLCFAPPEMNAVPRGLLPPRRVLEGVHRGIVDGGNQSGIPTVAGAFLFDPSFVGKPLVFCGTGGIMPASVAGEPAWEGEPQAGDLAVMVGGRIGRDGIHGATFSSLALDESSPLSAVQIGDPITQKKMSDFLLEARDRDLFRAITDNGAGGLSSSFGEMARACGGVRLELERAPLKYLGLAPWEILLSESQERMSLAVAPDRYDALAALARRRAVEVTAVGEFTADGTVEVRYRGELVGLLDLTFLHDGLPELVLHAHWPPRPCPPPPPAEFPAAGARETPASPRSSAPRSSAAPSSAPRSSASRPAAVSGDPAAPPPPPEPYTLLLRLLADPNIASKETLVRQYDHEVQALSVGKPFVGVRMDGPSDGAVLQPRSDSTRGITVTHGICPWYSAVDTYHMAQCAVDEAVRAHVACGGDPDRMVALDNFCWPDPIAAPDNPDGSYKLAQLVRAARGLRDACVAYRLPLISGKDSMKNDAFVDGRRISVLPTLLVSLLGIVPDVRRSLSSDFKRPGDRIFVVGEDRGELRATAFSRAAAALASRPAGDQPYDPADSPAGGPAGDEPDDQAEAPADDPAGAVAREVVGGAGARAGTAGTGPAAGDGRPAAGAGLPEGLPRGAPSVDAPAAMQRYRLLHRAVQEGLVASAHDVADGGLAVALAESAIGGRLGARVDLARVPGTAAVPTTAGCPGTGVYQAGTADPAGTGDHPAATGDHPTGAADPAATGDHPTGAADPAGTADHPAGTADHPAGTADHPAAAADHPAAAADHPAATGDHPAATGDHPAATGDHPAATGAAEAAAADMQGAGAAAEAARSVVDTAGAAHTTSGEPAPADGASAIGGVAANTNGAGTHASGATGQVSAATDTAISATDGACTARESALQTSGGGAAAEMPATWRWSAALFSETGGRLLVTVPAAHADRFAALFAGQACAEVGAVTAGGELTLTGAGAPVATWTVEELVRAWQTPI